MRDDDDLPVLSAVVRGGDAAVIRSMRLRDTRSVAARESGLFGALVDLDVEARAHEPTDAPDVARIDLGHAPVGIDASRDHGGRRASHLLADVRAALDEAIDERVSDRADAQRELDDTLPLDEEAGAAVRRPSTGAPAGDSSRARRSAGRRDVDVDDLVDRIVDRHVAALRRDVRDALERALARAGD